MAEHEWATERRVNDEKGVVTCRCGETFEYDVKGLGEYQIEKNRAEAVDRVEDHIEDARHYAQHDFANETTTQK